MFESNYWQSQSQNCQSLSYTLSLFISIHRQRYILLSCSNNLLAINSQAHWNLDKNYNPNRNWLAFTIRYTVLTLLKLQITCVLSGSGASILSTLWNSGPSSKTDSAYTSSLMKWIFSLWILNTVNIGKRHRKSE